MRKVFVKEMVAHGILLAPVARFVKREGGCAQHKPRGETRKIDIFKLQNNKVLDSAAMNLSGVSERFFSATSVPEALCLSHVAAGTAVRPGCSPHWTPCGYDGTPSSEDRHFPDYERTSARHSQITSELKILNLLRFIFN